MIARSPGRCACGADLPTRERHLRLRLARACAWAYVVPEELRGVFLRIYLRGPTVEEMAYREEFAR